MFCLGYTCSREFAIRNFCISCQKATNWHDANNIHIMQTFSSQKGSNFPSKLNKKIKQIN